MARSTTVARLQVGEVGGRGRREGMSTSGWRARPGVALPPALLQDQHGLVQDQHGPLQDQPWSLQDQHGPLPYKTSMVPRFTLGWNPRAGELPRSLPGSQEKTARSATWKREKTARSATWKREFKLPWREAGPPNHHDDEVDSDQ